MQLRVRWPLAVGTGLLGLALVRMRHMLPFVVEYHVWMSERGVDAELRHLDAPLMMLLASFAAARIAAGRGRVAAALGLRGSIAQGLRFGIVAAVPMAVASALCSGAARVDWSLLRGVVAMPFAEEVLFRGVFVLLPVALGGARFWRAAIPAGLLFGSMHVPWNDALAWSDVPVFAVTAAGGIWYAWLCRCFAWSLWPTIVLHAAMNASWLVFGVSDDAVGPLWPNVGRGLTIALGTVLALRHRRREARPGMP